MDMDIGHPMISPRAVKDKLRAQWNTIASDREVTSNELRDFLVETKGVNGSFSPAQKEAANEILAAANSDLKHLIKTDPKAADLYRKTQAMFAMVMYDCKSDDTFNDQNTAEMCAIGLQETNNDPDKMDFTAQAISDGLFRVTFRWYGGSFR